MHIKLKLSNLHNAMNFDKSKNKSMQLSFKPPRSHKISVVRKTMESPSQNQIWKTKRNERLNIYKNYNGGPIICKKKSRGVVGVPTNGDMLGEVVISTYLLEAYRYMKTKSRFSQNIKFHTTWHSHITSLYSKVWT